MEVTRCSADRGSSQGREIKKDIKHCSNLQLKSSKRNFGICFDVDGVLARGTIILAHAHQAFRMLSTRNNELGVPVCFFTNALCSNQDKAQQISSCLDIKVSPDQMVHSQSLLEVFTDFHSKHCLLIGQGNVQQIAKDIGFTKICTVEDIASAYPLLYHNEREHSPLNACEEEELPSIEAIILLGEPKHWESSLQILVDVLLTNGKPNRTPSSDSEEHLPVIACNMDLLYMHRSCIPRFGHGAFLLCLETLYRKLTGSELKYFALIDKPSEVSFRFVEQCLSREAKKLGIDEPLKTMYIIGDTPEVDIVGGNLYQRYVDRMRASRDTDCGAATSFENTDEHLDASVPMSRHLPSRVAFSKQTIEKVKTILVCTGIYKPVSSNVSCSMESNVHHGHRDFPKMSDLDKPTVVRNNVEEAVQYVLNQEQLLP